MGFTKSAIIAGAIGFSFVMTFGAIAYARKSDQEQTKKTRVSVTKQIRQQARQEKKAARAKAQSDAAATATKPAAPKPVALPVQPPAVQPAPVATAPAPKPAAKASLPGQVLNLTNWKIALPVDTPHAGTPDQITQPELAGFSLAPYFMVNDAGNGVTFRANAGGATTKNSSYPRSELREMTNGGKTEASWSNTSGTHTMTVRQAIMHLPAAKPEVVAAQIHDTSDDVIMIRLEGKRLFVESGGNNIGDLNTAYNLGTVYTARIVAQDGRIKVYYNDVLKVDIAKSGSTYYFKAGCYTQSNTSKGDAADAYGQVDIYALDVSHS